MSDRPPLVSLPLGERPSGDSQGGCAGCRHPFALHSNGTTECKAFACKSGPQGTPCPGFTDVAPLVAAAS